MTPDEARAFALGQVAGSIAALPLAERIGALVSVLSITLQQVPGAQRVEAMHRVLASIEGEVERGLAGGEA